MAKRKTDTQLRSLLSGKSSSWNHLAEDRTYREMARLIDRVRRYARDGVNQRKLQRAENRPATALKKSMVLSGGVADKDGIFSAVEDASIKLLNLSDQVAISPYHKRMLEWRWKKAEPIVKAFLSKHAA